MSMDRTRDDGGAEIHFARKWYVEGSLFLSECSASPETGNIERDGRTRVEKLIRPYSVPKARLVYDD